MRWLAVLRVDRWRLALLGLILGLAGVRGWAGVQGGPPAMPRRVVSLDLCTDWMLSRYAVPTHVAALSPLARRYPAPWMGARWSEHDGSLEAILQRHPDLVLTGQFNALQLRERLRALGLRVEVLPLPQTLAEVVAYEQRVRALVGLPAVSRLAQPEAIVPSTPRPRLLLLGANGIGTGRGTLEDEVLRQAGWANYVQAEGHVPLDLEQVVMDPPDAVVWAAPMHRAQANAFAEHPVLRARVPAHRWLQTDEWRWQCPGPWTWDLIQQLKQWQEQQRG